MKLHIAGVSHKTAPVQVREKLAIPEASLPGALEELQKLGASEAVVLSTCNRVELAISTPEEANAEGIVQEFLSHRPASTINLNGHLYHKEEREAIRHMFRVAASLDSMVVGEPQILGQLKDAYSAAKAGGTVGGVLETVMTRAFSVAKRVRTETGIGQMAVSVSYAAVELARKIFGSLEGHSVLIIGSGKMGELAAKHLKRSGANRIFVTNRTYERAQEMATLFSGKAVEYTAFLPMLHEIDIVIASSGAPHFILTKDEMQRVISQRKNKPMFLIDIAVPRNIDPAVNQIESVFLYDVDDLEGVVTSNLREREKQAQQAEEIVEHEVNLTLARFRVEAVAPTIVDLQEQLEAIRAGEFARAARRMNLTPEQQAQMEAMTKAMINKIAHGPISEIRRNASEPEGDKVIDAIRRVFHLQH